MKIDLEPAGFHQTIPLLQLIPKKSENRYFYENGLAKWITRLTLKVHSEIDECYGLWEKFSPKQTIFDNWDFCYSWNKGLNYKLFFYTLYEGKKSLGVLPLCFDHHDNRFEWFGSEWLENHKFFVEDKKFMEFLLTVAPSPLYLNSIARYDGVKNLDKFGDLIEDPDPRNIKHISSFSSIVELLKTFKKKARYNLRHDYRRLLSIGARVEMLETKDLSHFDELVSLNIQRFDGVAKERSYVEKYWEAFRNIIRNADLYSFKYVKVYVQNKVASIDMVITYKDIYYPLTGSNDVARFSGIGNFMTYIEYEDAIRGGFRLVDILQEDHGWKHHYFDKIPLFLFKK